MAGKENETRLPVVGFHGDNGTLIRLHEERMGRNEKRMEQIAADLDKCVTKANEGINALRREFVEQVIGLREEIQRRPREVILYIIVGAGLVLGGDTIRGIVERFLKL